jgi:hypothetical protein
VQPRRIPPTLWWAPSAAVVVFGLVLFFAGKPTLGLSTAALAGLLLIAGVLRPVRERRHGSYRDPAWWWDSEHTLNRADYLEGHALSRNDVVGARLVEIVQDYRPGNGIDFADTVLVLDTGFAFCLPDAEEGLTSASLPAHGRALRGTLARNVLGATVTDIVRPSDAPGWGPERLLVVLSTGWAVGVRRDAPDGIPAGAWLLSPEQRRVTDVSLWANSEWVPPC